MTNLKALLAISLFFVGMAVSKAQNADFQYINESKTLVRYFVEEKYDSVYARFDANMKQQLSKEYLETIWKQIESKYGLFETIKASQLLPNDELWMVDVVIGFVNQDVSAKITYDSTNKIAGIFFTPLNKVSSFYKIPDYADTSVFYEKNIKFGIPGWELEGTLTLPKNNIGKPLVMVLVPGLGAHERDLTLGKNKIFKDLAYGLSSKGIATFRFDKRTYTYKNKMSKQVDVDFDDVIVDDVIAAVNMLANSEEVDKNNILVAGHSFGGYLLPEIIERSEHIKGAIFLAAPARHLTEVLKNQYDTMIMADGKVDENEAEFIEKFDIQIKNALNISKNDRILPKHLPLGLTASFWKYIDDYDLKAHKNKKGVKMLFLHAMNDEQVNDRDWEIWSEIYGNDKSCTMIKLKDLNHIFHKVTQNEDIEDNQKLRHVDKSLLEIIFKWLNNN